MHDRRIDEAVEVARIVAEMRQLGVHAHLSVDPSRHMLPVLLANARFGIVAGGGGRNRGGLSQDGFSDA
jgi:hypothetical protein